MFSRPAEKGHSRFHVICGPFIMVDRGSFIGTTFFMRKKFEKSLRKSGKAKDR
jgi:hypothetical protein